MAATSLKLEVRDQEVRRVFNDFYATMRNVGDGPLKPFLRRIAARYLGFIRSRFVRASRGDGTWPDLALSTKIKRLRRMYRGRFARVVQATGGQSRGEQLALLAQGHRFAILRDRSILFASLTEGSPGNVINYLENGVEAGTNVFYGAYHQDPTVPGRPPRREILVQPDAATEVAMAGDAAEGLVAVLGGQSSRG